MIAAGWSRRQAVRLPAEAGDAPEMAVEDRGHARALLLPHGRQRVQRPVEPVEDRFVERRSPPPLGCSSTISMMPRNPSKPSGLGGRNSGSRRWISGSRAMIWWSASVLTRTPACRDRTVTVRFARCCPV